MSAIVIILLVVTGLVAGVISGMTGASGVMIVIPVLSTLLGFPVYAAIGTSLMADVIQSIPISYAYHRAKNLAIKDGMWLAVGSILGAQIGAHNVVLISENILMIGLSLFMVILGVQMWREGNVRSRAGGVKESSFALPRLIQRQPERNIIIGIFGVLLGLMTGFFGAGGGIMIFLVLFFVLRLSLKKSIGTAAFIMIITALSGAIGYFFEGNVNWLAGLIIGGSAAVGGYTSAYIANNVDDQMLGKIVGVIFIVVAIMMLAIRFAL